LSAIALASFAGAASLVGGGAALSSPSVSGGGGVVVIPVDRMNGDLHTQLKNFGNLAGLKELSHKEDILQTIAVVALVVVVLASGSQTSASRIWSKMWKKTQYITNGSSL
jgi:hypothetical protein